MLIKCPKCNTSYDVGSALIPEGGKKVRCSQCGEVWTCLASDLFATPEIEAEPSADNETAVETVQTVADNPLETPTDSSAAETAPKKVDNAAPAKSPEMQEIFARLESQTETLFEMEKNLPPHKKIWTFIKKGLGLQRRRNRRMWLGTFLVLFLLTLFYLRYEIVRIAPFMEGFYNACHIDCVIPGEGLEFQNITRNEYEEDYVNKMEIRGFITNITGQTLNVPVIQIQLLDKNVQPLQVIYQEPPVQRIIAGSKIAFRIIVNKPSTFSKYVYLTFTKDHPADTVKAVNTRPLDQ